MLIYLLYVAFCSFACLLFYYCLLVLLLICLPNILYLFAHLCLLVYFKIFHQLFAMFVLICLPIAFMHIFVCLFIPSVVCNVCAYLLAYCLRIISFICCLFLAPADYIAVNGIITFPPDNITNRMRCGITPIIMDDVVEDTETFFTILTSSDRAVNITQDNGTTNILDNTSKHIHNNNNNNNAYIPSARFESLRLNMIYLAIRNQLTLSACP